MEVKYTPRELQGNVNVAEGSLLKEFFLLVGGFLAGISLVYVLLGYTVDLVVTKLPPELERRLGELNAGMYPPAVDGRVEEALQRILDGLSRHGSGTSSPPWRVHLAESGMVNAVALPGGHIVIYSGLLDAVESENELAFVLAHEMGHFAHRDHLRGLGRRLVLFVMAASLFGRDSAVSDFAGRSLGNLELKFSREQEEAADLSAVDLLYRRYGHAGGATEFMQRLAAVEGRGPAVYLFSTHPHPRDRIKALREYIRQRGYPVGEMTPLPPVLKSRPAAGASPAGSPE